jgi:hypothetical protein
VARSARDGRHGKQESPGRVDHDYLEIVAGEGPSVVVVRDEKTRFQAIRLID